MSRPGLPLGSERRRTPGLWSDLLSTPADLSYAGHCFPELASASSGLGQPSGEAAQVIRDRSCHLFQTVLEFGEPAGSERIGETIAIGLEERITQRQHLLTAGGPRQPDGATIPRVGLAADVPGSLQRGNRLRSGLLADSELASQLRDGAPMWANCLKGEAVKGASFAMATRR
jgi:hypothetical protein